LAGAAPEGAGSRRRLRPSGASTGMACRIFVGGRGVSGLRRRIPEQTRMLQASAADPQRSVWVSANAGSGKTYVLARRVMRLLLGGADPARILCLTYTRSAAANMALRVFAELARWSTLPDEELRRQIGELEGRVPDDDRLRTARRLFARALETPGGLKIQTIHAFCEAVLHRFPLEAGVPYDFTVIEDDERAAMLLAARESVLAEGIGVEGAVETLFETLSDEQIRGAIDAAMEDGRELRTVLADPEKAKVNLERLVGLGQRDIKAIAGALERDTVLTPELVSEL